MKLLRIAVLILMTLIIILCITLICLILELDDDSNVILNYIIMCCSGIFILLTIIEGYFYLARPKSRQIQYPRIILLILATIVILYAAITQISRALLDNNGDGKVPIIDPHDADWYRLKTITRIIEYFVCTVVIIIQILIVYKKKQQTQNTIEESVLINQQPLITSLEPHQSIKQNNTQNNYDSSSQMINTLESKNTNYVNAIKKLNEQQNT